MKANKTACFVGTVPTCFLGVVWWVDFSGGAEDVSECPGVEVPWKPTEDRTRPRLFLGGCVIPDKNCTGKFGWWIVQETRLDGYAGLSAIGKFNFLLELPNATGIDALSVFEGDAVDGEPSPEHADDEIKH